MGETPLRGNPARQLNHVARLLTRVFDRRLAPLGLSVAHLPVLGALKEKAPQSQKELAEVARIGQPAMAQMLDRLVREGLLLRTTDSQDRRKAQFALSDRAEECLAMVEAELAAGNAAGFSVLSPEEVETLMQLLHRLERHLSAEG